MVIEFPEYLPDMPAHDNPGSTVVKNVIPSGGSYRQMKELAAFSDALSAYPRGYINARNPSTGSSANFTGDGTKLYLMANSLWTNVSKPDPSTPTVPGVYALGTDEQWAFTQFGARILATGINQPIQSYVIGTSTLFADLSSSGPDTAPQARYIATVKDFVVVGNTFDATDSYVANRVRWSGIGDSTKWAVSATTQADYQDLDAEHGWVQAVVGGEYGIIFQETAITRMDYIGSPLVFQFQTVEVNRGTSIPKSVIRVGALTFYYGIDGFYVFNGTHSEPIGENKVDRFFANDLDVNYLDRVSVAADYNRHIIAWSYPAAGNTGGRPNKILLFNYAPNSKKRWAVVEMEHDFLANTYSNGYTLDGLDAYMTSVLGIPANIDNLGHSLDSRIFTGDDLLFAGFDTDHKIATFTGAAMAAVIETAEVQINPGQRTNLLSVAPIVDTSGFSSADVNIQVGTRNRLSETVTYSSAVSVDSTQECNFRSNARYHRLRLNITGGFEDAIGFEIIQQRKAGSR